MIKSLTVISLLATGVFAQSAENPLIPSGISQQCQTFLNQLNSDTSLTACTDSLISVTSAYGPGGSAGASTSYAAVTSSLGQLCSANDACPESLIRGTLADFYPACQAELTTQPNEDVLAIYDILYAITPFKTALCSKGDDGNYCVIEGPEAGSSLNSRSRISRRQDTAVTPNISAYRSNNTPFLFLTPNLDTSALCTACTRNIIAAYIQFESNIAYAPGLAQSGLLGGQSDLYSAIQEKCGSTFLSGPVQAAGGLGSGNSVPFLRGAGYRTSTDMHGSIAAFAGMLSLVAAVM